MPSRPVGSRVNTNCDRLCRGRSRTRSIATPRRRHSRAPTSSTTWASSGQAVGAMAVHAARAWPRVARLEHQPRPDRQPDEEWQAAVRFGISSHQKAHRDQRTRSKRCRSRTARRPRVGSVNIPASPSLADYHLAVPESVRRIFRRPAGKPTFSLGGCPGGLARGLPFPSRFAEYFAVGR
jgi:hypothetical protein